LGAGGRAFKSPRPDQTIVFSAVQFPIVRVHGGGHLSQVQRIVRVALTAKDLRIWDKPRVISCCEEFAQHLALPRGCLQEVGGVKFGRRCRER